MRWLKGLMCALVLGALGMTVLPAVAAAEEEVLQLDLDVAAGADGSVIVNGVVFEAELGLTSDQVVALVQAGLHSLDGIRTQPQAVQERLNAVLTTLAE